MKKLIVPFLLLTCIGFQSCKKENKQEVKVSKEEEKIVSVQCYKAIYEADTIDLKLNTLKSGKISGDMKMRVAGSPEKVGKVKGEFHGDTLFVDYSFFEGKNKTFKNPMAFLKKEAQLILGNAKMQTTMGVTYIVKDEPIDFERVKYKFTTVECAK